MQTLTIREAETQLQSLVKQAQTTHQSVILTNDIATPVAVLTFFEPEPSGQNEAALRHLEIVTSVLQMWQQYADDPMISQDAAHLFQSQLRQLNTTTENRPPAFAALLMLLRLAARQIIIPTPQAQVQALAIGIEALRNPDLSWAQIEMVDRQLLESGIDARANLGDNELVKSYVDVS